MSSFTASIGIGQNEKQSFAVATPEKGKAKEKKKILI